MKAILLFLACTNKDEADKISLALLQKRLAACIKKLSINSDYLWKGKIENADEILLIIESREKLFDKIEETVKMLHSYKVPILIGIPIIKTSKGITKWFDDEIK